MHLKETKIKIRDNEIAEFELEIQQRSRQQADLYRLCVQNLFRKEQFPHRAKSKSLLLLEKKLDEFKFEGLLNDSLTLIRQQILQLRENDDFLLFERNALIYEKKVRIISEQVKELFDFEIVWPMALESLLEDELLEELLLFLETCFGRNFTLDLYVRELRELLHRSEQQCEYEGELAPKKEKRRRKRNRKRLSCDLEDLPSEGCPEYCPALEEEWLQELERKLRDLRNDSS